MWAEHVAHTVEDPRVDWRRILAHRQSQQQHRDYTHGRPPAHRPVDEQSSIPVDQDLLCGLLGSGGVVGPFDEFAVLELRAGADERHEMGRVDRPPA